MNRYGLKSVIITGGLILLSLLNISCGTGEEKTPDAIETKISIADIISAPEKYEGETVTINGEYRGWEAGYGTAPVTRSDWVLKDATGALYVTALIPPGLDPVDDRGTALSVYGVVKIHDSQVYLEAKEIK